MQEAAPVTHKTARFDEQGDVTIDLSLDVLDDPRYPDFLAHVAAIPPSFADWESPDYPTTLWLHWMYAPPAVRRLKALYPDLQIDAPHNPWFGRSAELAERLGEALAAIKEAEAVVREQAARVGRAA